MNKKLLAGLAVIVLFMGLGSFTFGHTANAESHTPTKVKTKVDKQRENRAKWLESTSVKDAKDKARSDALKSHAHKVGKK